ncbi:DUF202 domain-containing protein [Micrococcus sp. HG099]|uniref:DUF202 domain-containing protein n=1 Tax=Micrococcus sp. HG099 TaxID=2969755 RepID=UPI00215A1A76|nr:DUF202 domain-containing protein [Micrococcus sp. HG099]MCR8674711.1 DUF202 domain-containing protein [Micrococcus sp. HG099]
MRLHHDPGLQPERTVMSWGRTVLALGVLSLMFLRWWPAVGAWAFGPAVVAAVGGAAVLATQRRRYVAQSRGIAGERARPALASVAGMVALVVGLAALGITATLLHSA